MFKFLSKLIFGEDKLTFADHIGRVQMGHMNMLNKQEEEMRSVFPEFSVGVDSYEAFTIKIENKINGKCFTIGHNHFLMDGEADIIRNELSKI